MYQITLSIPAGPGLSLDVTRSMEATFYQSSHDLTQQNCLHQHQLHHLTSSNPILAGDTLYNSIRSASPIIFISLVHHQQQI